MEPSAPPPSMMPTVIITIDNKASPSGVEGRRVGDERRADAALSPLPSGSSEHTEQVEVELRAATRVAPSLLTTGAIPFLLTEASGVGEFSDYDDDEFDDDEEEDENPVKDIGHSRLADLARRSLRARVVRRRLAQHRLRRRQQQARMCALALSRQIQILRRDKDILTNFVRLRLYETQSSFSGSDVASSSGMDRSSDSERRLEESRPEQAEVRMSPAAEGETDEDGSGRGSRAHHLDDVRKILRLRRRRRRHLLQQTGELAGRGERVEQYTDTTRNAAVVMGEKDIKQSLRQQRRSLAAARGLCLPTCAQPAGLTALARAHRRAGQPRAALVLLEQALLLDPLSRRVLLERAECYLRLGQPRLALLGAEDALDLDRNCDSALYLKAQALYAMGHFEKALVVYHRGDRLRPDNAAFKTGIQQAKEAIMNTIGCLSKDFHLSSFERLLSSWRDEEHCSSVGSVALAATGARKSDRAPGLEPGSGSDLQVFGVPGSSSGCDESDRSSAGGGDECGARGLCDSCNTLHRFGDDKPLCEPPFADVEEEARKIALILSITNSFDGRNKHLRDNLLLDLNYRPAVPVTATQSASALGARRDTQEACRLLKENGIGKDKDSRVPERWVARAPHRRESSARSKRCKIESSRPGVERIPPSLGTDIEFLQQIAFDPALRGLRASSLAEEGVRYLKTRQIFWFRRGPIHSDSDTARTPRARTQRGRRY